MTYNKILTLSCWIFDANPKVTDMLQWLCSNIIFAFPGVCVSKPLQQSDIPTCSAILKYPLDFLYLLGILFCRRYSLMDLFELLVFVYSLLEEREIESHHERNLKVGFNLKITSPARDKRFSLLELSSQPSNKCSLKTDFSCV